MFLQCTPTPIPIYPTTHPLFLGCLILVRLQLMSIRYVLLLASVLLTAPALIAQTTSQDLRVYAYISPAAKHILNKIDSSETELIDFANSQLKRNSIFPIDPNRVYEGSEDALRIDIRKVSAGLTIELSVRQGVSIHNMLQRWWKRQQVQVDLNSSPGNSKKILFNCITQMLGDLKKHHNSPKYLQGKMLED